jgi:uncharacterized protein
MGKVREGMLARPLPAITDMNSYFWCGGKDGHLIILRCRACGHYAHPYAGRCVSCGSKEMAPEAVSGRATVVGFSVNYQPWFPHVPVPYVVAVVTIEEQEDIFLITDIVDCDIEKVAIGLKVQVLFERYSDIYIPLFEPIQENA